MALRDPIAVYNAANNLEAAFVRDALIDSGVEAFVTEDVSVVGGWVGGLVPEIHKPQVWVERADVERAKPVLDDYERRAIERKNPDAEALATGPPIEVVCEQCSASASFPPSQRGSVQDCPNCGAFVDVGDEETSEYWLEGQAEQGMEDEP